MYFATLRFPTNFTILGEIEFCQNGKSLPRAPGQPPSSVRTFQIRVPGRQCNDLRAVTEIAGTGTGYLSEPLTKPSVTVRYRM